MNPLFKPTEEESRVIELINNYNLNEFALIRITKTMLKKSIIDASEGLRKILFKNKLINFKRLIPGGAKKYKASIILTSSPIETEASFYRPKSKKGDPRFWPYKLKKHTSVNELVYLTIFDDKLIVIPIKDIKTIQSSIRDIFDDIEKDEIVIKLKQKLSALRSGKAIKSVSPHVSAPKDVGLTLESFLGIKVNSVKTPDYLGKIEIKTKRKNSKKDSLFSRVPDSSISKYKTVNEIINKFGRPDKKNRKALKNDITTKPNTHGLYLCPNNKELILFQKYKLNNVKSKVCAWHYETLKKALETKHPTTLWVEAEEKIIGGKIHFAYQRFELTTKPVFSEFISLIERDLINFDWKAHIENGKRRDHGPGFRINGKNRKFLFKTLINISL